MKKVRVLKYLILICTLMVSFFIFARGGVNALEYSVNDGKIVLDLEQADAGDETKGYVIKGATLSAGVTSINNWSMPSVYEGNGYPIVGIKDGENNQTGGVLNALASVVTGNVILGENIEYIGLCAFCDFSNVTQYELNDKLSSVGEYAFAYNTSLENVVVKAYNDNIRTSLASANVFNSSINLKRIVFKNSTIAKVYKERDVWSSLSATFTYKVKYRYYNETNTGFTPVDYYFDEKLGSVPADIEKNGLKFSWVTKVSDKTIEVNANSFAIDVNQVDENFDPVLDVKPKWELKGSSELFVKTSIGGTSTEHKDAVKKVEITYSGKNNKLSIQTIVNHEFIDVSDSNFTVSYSWVKRDGNNITTPVIGEDIIFMYQTGESGMYICTITMSYPGYDSVKENVQINVNIKKKDVTINVANQKVEYGTYLTKIDDAGNAYYSVDEETPLAEGESVKTFNFLGYCKNINGSCEKSSVGTIPGVLNGEVVNVGYDGDNTDYSEHYNFTYTAGNLTIEPKIISHTLEEDIEVIYGSSSELIEVKTISVYGENTSINIRYIREDSSNYDAGEYEVLNASVVKENDVVDSNYIIQLSAINPGKVVIKPKPVQVEWNIIGDLVYDQSEKMAAASYQDINNMAKELFVTIKKNGKLDIIKNAGIYELTASMISNDSNYELVEFSKTIEVKKAQTKLEGRETQTVTYNGKPQRVNLTLNPGHDGVIDYGNYDHCKNANETTASYCSITVRVEGTDNYEGAGIVELGQEPLIYKLRILRVRKEVEPKVFEHTYGTSISSNSLCDMYPGAGEESVSICFSVKNYGIGSELLAVGNYDIQTAYTSESLNYDVRLKEGTGVNKIKINPAPIQIRFYFYEGLVYDGNVKDVRVRYEGTQEDVGLTLDYGEKEIIKNAGNYRIEANISNSNYYIDGANYVEFSVAKAKYDVSNIKLNNKNISFNFKNHFINLEGELPDGLTPVYTIDGNKGNGTYLPFKHTVKVSFEGDYDNYEYVEALTATLNVKMTWVWVTLGLILLFGGVVPISVYLLVFKYKIIKFEALRKALSRKSVSRLRIRKMIKKNRELEQLNRMFREKQAAWYASQPDQQEEIEIIEEPIKFVKNPINTKPESLIEMSFVDELFKSSYGTKQLYSEIKNELLSYEGVVSKIKRDFETFYLNNIPIAKLDVVKGTLIAYFALDPNQYKKEEYKHVDVSKEKEFASVPLKLTVKTLESLRHAKMFVRIIRKREGIKSVSNFIRTDYVDIYTAKENTFSLFKKAFVKKGTKEYEED